MSAQEALMAHGDLLLDYTAHLRMMHLWFHGAHHLTSGTGFAGDHVDLFGRIYTEIQDQIDGVIEKSIGLVSEELGDPLKITLKAVELMQGYQTPTGQSATAIALTGLQIERDFLEFCQEMYQTLEANGALTLGLDDMIMANASEHETFVYLLQQRVREAMQSQKPQGVAVTPAAQMAAPAAPAPQG
jgi:DNA-binding ferritin-like protein